MAHCICMAQAHIKHKHCITITNLIVHSDKTGFDKPFQFDIEYECLHDLPDDLEWRVIYCVGDESLDQELEMVLVGPVNTGHYRFWLQCNPPDVARIPVQHIVSKSVVLLTCSYHGKEMLRVGYFVNNMYEEDKLVRVVLADKPRVTRFAFAYDELPAPAEETETQ